jgi:hypothetical protein
MVLVGYWAFGPVSHQQTVAPSPQCGEGAGGGVIEAANGASAEKNPD